jgi:benzoate/toluate 1,2-dioxygenase beta subunit
MTKANIAKSQARQGGSLDTVLKQELWDFICLEAQYADESRYDDWEGLWSDAPDSTYWIPLGYDALNPQRQSSIIYDNRARVATRIRQLRTGVRYAQVPASPMRRVISNMIARQGGEEPESYEVESNFILLELAIQSTHNMNMWAGRTYHNLRREPKGLRIHSKRIMLVNSGEPIPNIAFLI